MRRIDDSVPLRCHDARLAQRTPVVIIGYNFPTKSLIARRAAIPPHNRCFSCRRIVSRCLQHPTVGERFSVNSELVTQFPAPFFCKAGLEQGLLQRFPSGRARHDLTFSALLTLLGRRSRQSIYDLMRRDPSFPRPRQLGSEFSIGWLRTEVMQWLTSRPLVELNGLDAIERRRRARRSGPGE